jgi:hypothetical protein
VDTSVENNIESILLERLISKINSKSILNQSFWNLKALSQKIDFKLILVQKPSENQLFYRKNLCKTDFC